MGVSVKDVAARAGVSVGTVSNAMNHPEKVSADTRERIQAAIEDLGYIRNDAARQLRVGRSETIGMIVLDVRNPFFTDVARGAEDAAAEAGLSITLGNSDEDPEREAAYLDLFEQQRVVGVLLSPHGDASARMRRLAERGIRSVLVDRLGDADIGSVAVDDVAGGRLAVNHLTRPGPSPHRIRRRTHAHRADERAPRRRASRCRAARGLSLEVIETDHASVIDGRAAGQAIVARSDRPDAVFAGNDLLAMGVLQAFAMQGAGVRVPDDIALIGYDDIDFAAAAVVPLSSIRQPARLIGRTAVEMLLSDAAPTQVVFQPELVARESTGG